MRLAFLWTFFAANISLANPLDSFGLGPRAIALGGAVASDVRDSAATYYNPAGLAFSDKLRIDFGYVLMRPQLEINGHSQEVDDSRGVQLGVSVPGSILSKRLGIGLSVHLPDEHISRIRALPAQQPRWILWDNRPQRIVITSSAGLELLDGLSLGVGLTYLANTAGVLNLTGDVDLADPALTRLLAGVDVDLTAVRYVSAGLQWHPDPHWSFGLTYREDFRLALDIGVDVSGDVVVGDSVVVEQGQFVVRSVSRTMFSPQQVTGSVSYNESPLRIGFEIGWLQYSRFPSPAAQVDIELDLSPLTVALPTPAQPGPPRFRDIMIPRIGVEWLTLKTQALSMMLRTGYFFEASPVPSQRGQTNFVDNDKHGISFGAGFEIQTRGAIIDGPLTIDIAALWIELANHHVEKSNPVDPIGDYTHRGRLLGISSSIGVTF